MYGMYGIYGIFGIFGIGVGVGVGEGVAGSARSPALPQVRRPQTEGIFILAAI